MRHIPAREDLDTLESIRLPGNLQWEAVERIEPGQALIIDSRGDTSAGSGGLMLMTRLARRGAVAAITDGAFRDTPDLSGIGIPFYARGQCAATRLLKFHVADLNVPIACGGVAVYPGDILVGDRELVVVVPRHVALDVSVTRWSEKSSRPGYTNGSTPASHWPACTRQTRRPSPNTRNGEPSRGG